MKKCNYCGRTEICKGSYPEGCFLENEILLEEYSFKIRYRAVLKSMGWNNQKVADITGNSLNSIEFVTTKPNKDYPRWVKAFIVLHEEMIAKGRVTYDKPEVYKVKTDKK